MAGPLHILKRFGVHSALLVGCLLFAFPFLWLVSTSFKQRDEVAIFPPRWIPRIPWYAEQSPFIDGQTYDPMDAPDQMSDANWKRLRPDIERVLWAAFTAKSDPERLRAAESMADGSYFRPQILDGMWLQSRELVPEEMWKSPDALPDFLARSATAEMVERAWINVVRQLAVGKLKIRHISNDPLTPESTSGWQTVGPVTLLADTQIESEACRTLRYDLREADAFTLTQTLHLPAGTTVRDLQAVGIPIHCDASWHRLEVTIESGGLTFRAERPMWMDIRSWQEAEYVFQRPDYTGSRSIVFVADPAAPSDVTDPGTVRLTLTWQKSSRLRTLVDKYIDSYRWALRYIPFDTQLRNTVILVILNVLGQLFACSLAAYGFARLNFWGRDLLFGLLLATMMLPGQVTMIPTFVLWKWLGWYNTLQPLWVPAWFGGAFFIFLLRQFFMTIPKELEDAAKIDGCGFFGIYWRIMLPLAGPALATVAIFSLMGAWNEFVQPLVYLSDERLFPLSLGLNQFRQEQAAEWSWLMAASTMMMLPVIAVFFFCQRYFIQGITLTGLKG